MKNSFNLLLTITVITLVSCNNIDVNEQKKQTLTIVESNYPTTLFPASVASIEQAHIISQIHDGLMSWDIENNKPAGQLVKRWVVNNNQDNITFNLYSDIYFHDDDCFPEGKGRLLNTSDVKFSIEYTIWHKAVNKRSIGLLKYIQGSEEYLNSIDNKEFVPGKLHGIKIIDSTRFTIQLKEPNSSFLKSLIGNDLAILPPEGIKKYGADCVVGCGPFVFSKRNEQKKTIELVKNKNYYKLDSQGNKLPYLDNVTFIFEATPTKSLRLLRDHKADLLLSMEQKHIKAFVEDNIDLFEKKYPDLILKQAKGLEKTNIYMIKRGAVKNLKYSTMNILQLDKVRIEEVKNEKQPQKSN